MKRTTFLWVLLPLALGDSDGETEGEAGGSEEDHPLAHGVNLGGVGGLGGHTHVVPALGGIGSIRGLGGHTHVGGGGEGASFVAGDGEHVHFNTPFGHSIIALSGEGNGGGYGVSGGGESGGSAGGSEGGGCAIAYELQCANSGDAGPANSLLDCPSGEEEICIDVTESQCTTSTKSECRDYVETDCEIEQKEVCIKADQSSCIDTEFAASSPLGGGYGSNEQCRSVETQRCGPPKGEQVCANIGQVKCVPETISVCKTTVTVQVQEECIHFQEPECRVVQDQMCFQGYGTGDCHVNHVQECKFVNRQGRNEKVCNFVSKPTCNSGAPSPQCHTINSQKCTMKPNTRCIKVPKVVPVEQCESKTINNCREVPGRECLTIYKTECSGPERQDICFNIPGSGNGGGGFSTLTNRFCEGQSKDICFNTDRTVCSKKDKTQCFDIPTTTCEKVTSQKCFTVKTPPKLVQVPKANCGTGTEKETGTENVGVGGDPRIHHIHIAAPQVHHAPAHSHSHQTHFVPAAAPVVAAAPIVASTAGYGGVGLGGVGLGRGVAALHPAGGGIALGGGVALGGVGLGRGIAAVHPGFGGGSHQSVSTPHSHHHTHVDNNRFGK